MQVPYIFKTSCMVNFGKYSKKKFRFGEVKMTKSNKTEETDKLIA